MLEQSISGVVLFISWNISKIPHFLYTQEITIICTSQTTVTLHRETYYITRSCKMFLFHNLSFIHTHHISKYVGYFIGPRTARLWSEYMWHSGGVTYISTDQAACTHNTIISTYSTFLTICSRPLTINLTFFIY